MNGIAIGLALLGAVGTIVFLAWPWWRQPSEEDRGETLDDRYEAVLGALRELDFDRTTGKVGIEDYAPLRQALLNEAGGIIARRDEQAQPGNEEWTNAEREHACPTCSWRVRPRDLFCAGCGLDLDAAGTECRHCGKRADLWDLFCRSCGGELVVAPDQTRSEGVQGVRP